MAERPTGHQVPIGDEGGVASSARPGGGTPPEPSHAERCRTLVASASRGALSTLAADPQGYPYGSVASYGLDDRGNPLFFVSLMAEHTQNAVRDPRASLLVTEPVPDGADPLASGRATLLGLLSPVAEDDASPLATRTSRPTQHRRTTSTSATSYFTASTCGASGTWVATGG
ncbi:MAG: pyridoxamine 5'-phosphate oxidase family protein [Acidimicrobiales bacterium]